MDGRNIRIEYVSSDGRYERLPGLAAYLVRLKVDIIVAPAAQNVVAAIQATRTIPIVIAREKLALEAAKTEVPVVIDAKATAEDDAALETLEAVNPPEDFNPGGGRR